MEAEVPRTPRENRQPHWVGTAPCTVCSPTPSPISKAKPQGLLQLAPGAGASQHQSKATPSPFLGPGCLLPSSLPPTIPTLRAVGEGQRGVGPGTKAPR